MYVAALGCIGLIVRRRPRRGVVRYLFIAAVVIAGSVAALAAGRSTPITIRHATVLQQFDGAAGGILQSRAMAEFPVNSDFAIRPSLMDTAFDLRPGRDVPLEQRFDADGYPVITGRFGLGGTQPFTIEASGDLQVFEVARVQGTTRVVNASAFELRGCEFPSGFSERTLESFPSGAQIEAAEPIAGADPMVACRFARLPLDFSDANRPVVTDGTTIAVYHLQPADDPR
jgi:hypothetical protein